MAEKLKVCRPLQFYPEHLSRGFVSGEAEGEDEWRTQQTPLRHGGQASVRVQRETTAPPQREDGSAGGKGNKETDEWHRILVTVVNKNV